MLAAILITLFMVLFVNSWILITYILEPLFVLFIV